MYAFHPLVARWFTSRFGAVTDAERRAWPLIGAGRDVLIAAPTGSGKTLAAFLICLDRLIGSADAAGSLPDETAVVYVSPLRALSYDIHANLETPLAEMAELVSAAAERLVMPPIRVAVRTGDTRQWERQMLVRRPPHILVTTPESLFILLTAERSRRFLQTTRTVIVDEIHATVDDKRGSHLSLSLARLDDLVRKAGGTRPQRIGLSATVKPIEEVARFLAGGERDVHVVADDRSPEAAGERGTTSVWVVDCGHRRTLDLAVEVPHDELGIVATHEMWEEIYDRIAALVGAHRTTIVFVNTRRLCERLAHHLGERLGETAVLAHHGSLSRRLRHEAESRLKNGELRAVVATASLELGIDIGSVDLVCQIGSPRSIAVMLQRIGRSGHGVDTPDAPRRPKGRLFATTRDELLECAALISASRSGLLDRLAIPPWPRDVLAQQIVAAAACESWHEDDLFALVREAYPYHDLPRAEFDALVDMLAEGIATQRGRSGAFLHRDRVNGVVRGRRGARLAAITSGGAIPDNANYLVVAEPEGTTVGTVDEDFAVESLAGDVFLLGTTSWRIRRVEAGRVRVEDAHGAAPSLPFWRGEAPGRTDELSGEVSRIRSAILEQAAPLDFLMRECGLDRAGAEQAVAYVRAGAAALGALPAARTVVAERFFDEGGGMQLVIHAPFGARINRAWGLALRKRFCRTFNFELQAAATDNGIVISLAEQHSFPLEAVFRFLNVDTVGSVLTQAMLDAPMFTARWRWDGSRALAVLRFAGGRKVPPPIQRMRSDDLLASVFPDQVACAENLTGDVRIPDHPLVNETIRDCLHEAMDLDGLQGVLSGIEDGTIRTVAIDTAEPSPFSHEILNANPYAYLDDAPLEERRARAVQMRRSLGPEAARMGALDPEAIATVAAESWPVVRDADELHDALLTLAVAPPVAEWSGWFEELQRTRRAGCLRAGETTLWVATERLALARQIYPGAAVGPPDLPALDGARLADSQEAAVVETLRGWLESSGPETAASLANRLALSRPLVDAALARLEGEGQILRGRFTPGAGIPLPSGESVEVRGTDIEWCNRRVLARIHRLTLGRLRREIEPVSTADFVRFLYRWQHLAAGTRLHGAAGLLQVLRQLQGYEIPAAAWEPEVLSRRVAKYDPELLDRLCLSGDIVWGRLSPHPAFEPNAVQADRRWNSAEPRSGEVQVAGVGPRDKLKKDRRWNSAEPETWRSPEPMRRVKTRRISSRGWGPASIEERQVAGVPPSRLRRFGEPRRSSLDSDASGGGAPRDTLSKDRRVRPTRVAPVAILLRDDMPWLLDASAEVAAPPPAALSHAAREVLDALERRGASFLSELVRTTGRLTSEVEDGLWELVAAGLVTADGFDNLRALIDPKRRRGEGRFRAARPRHSAGRWAMLRPASGQGTAATTRPGTDRSREELVERFAEQLLLRWGVVFRDLVARETIAPPWRELLASLRRLEARGTIRGGRFVTGFPGEQFARPEAVDLLRAVRRDDARQEPLRVAAADPLNLTGVILPGPRISGLAGGTVDLLPERSDRPHVPVGQAVVAASTPVS